MLDIRLQQLFMWAFGLILLSLAWPSAAAQLDDIHISTTAERTRVIFSLSDQVESNIFTLDNPPRIVVDLAKTNPKVKKILAESGRGVIKQVRSGMRNGQDLRVVLDLKRKKVLPQGYALPPSDGHKDYRIVIDLARDSGPKNTDEADEETQSLAAEVAKQGEQKQGHTPIRSRDVVVVIDPGHGGHDPGAIGPTGIMEKNVVLAIAKRLAVMINRQPHMTAYLTRDKDIFLPLRKRTKVAHEKKADLFISIHANSSTSAKPWGAAVFALSLDGATSEHARVLAARENAAPAVSGISLGDKDEVVASFMLDLAQSATIEASLDVGDRVLSNLKSHTKLLRSEVEQAAFVVLKSPDIPSLLVETGFISNSKEEKRLNSASFQNQLAQSILKGVKGYFQSYQAGFNSDEEQTHTVARGENLSQIASRYNVGLHKLEKYNHLKSTQLQVGQKLRIPATN